MKSVLDEAMSLSRKRSDAMIARSSDVKAATPSSVISPGRDDTLAYAPPSRARQHAAEQGKYFKGWPYAAIAPIAKRIASREVRVARVAKSPVKHRSKAFLPGGFKGIEGEYGAEVIPGHPLVRAIEDGGSHAIKWSLIYNLVAGIRIWGRGYWWVQRRSKQAVARGEPEWEVCDIPADWIEPIHTDLQPFAAWKVTPPGATTPWIVPADEIVPFHYPDPRDPLNGFSELQAVDQAVVTDDYIQTAQKKGFQQGIHPGWIITLARQPDVTGSGPGVRPILTQEQRAQFVHELKAYHRGVIRFDEPAIIDGRVESMTKSTNNAVEMGYGESGKIVKDRITQGFGCFVPGTKIWTSSGVRDIETVKVGDTVLTHKGRWRKVISTFAREYEGDLRKVRLVGSHGEIGVTPEHPFLVQGEWIDAKNLRPTLGRSAGHRCEWPGLEETDLDPKVIFRVARSRGVGTRWECVETAVTPELAWTMGLYLAEGYRRSGGIAFSGHEKETEDRLETISTAFAVLCQTKPTVTSDGGNGEVISQVGQGLSEWFSEAFGIKSSDKKIPEFIYRWPVALRRSFVCGYLAGDGHDDGGCGYVTTSIQVAHGVRQILRSLGYRPTLVKRAAVAPPVICGKQVATCQVAYQSRTSGVSRDDIANGTGGSRTTLTVRANEPAEYQGMVHNLEVEEDNSYVLASGAAVHNCNPAVMGQLDGANRASSLIADEQFLANTVNPLIEFISQTLTAWLGPLFAEPGERILVYIEPAVAVDAELELKQSLALYDRGLLDGNALLKITMNLPPIPGGNVCFIRPELVPYVIPSDDDPDPDFEANPFVKQFLSRPQPTPSAQKPPNATLGEGQSGGADGGT